MKAKMTLQVYDDNNDLIIANETITEDFEKIDLILRVDYMAHLFKQAILDQQISEGIDHPIEVLKKTQL